MTAVSSLMIFFCGETTIIRLIIFAINIVGGQHYFADDLTGVTEREQSVLKAKLFFRFGCGHHVDVWFATSLGFVATTQFPQGQFCAYYTTWVHKSVNETLIQGVYTCKKYACYC